jgi:hypothetical protein
MKTTVALAVFLMFAVATFGQAVQRPQTPQQQETPTPLRPRAKGVPIPNWPANKRAPVILIPTQIQSQSALVRNGILRATPLLKPGSRGVPIPNWPADKPAPIIPIPTQIQPESGLVKNGVLRLTPTAPSQPCAIYVNNGRDYQFLEGTLPSSVKPQKRTTSKDIDDITQAGREVKILSQPATRDDIEAARWACRR